MLLTPRLQPHPHERSRGGIGMETSIDAKDGCDQATAEDSPGFCQVR